MHKIKQRDQFSNRAFEGQKTLKAYEVFATAIYRHEKTVRLKMLGKLKKNFLIAPCKDFSNGTFS